MPSCPVLGVRAWKGELTMATKMARRVKDKTYKDILGKGGES